MRTAFDFPEESLHDIVGPNRLPMLLWKRVKGQTRLQITLQTLDRTRIDLLVFLDEGGHGLISGSISVCVGSTMVLWFGGLQVLQYEYLLFCKRWKMKKARRSPCWGLAHLHKICYDTTYRGAII